MFYMNVVRRVNPKSSYQKTRTSFTPSAGDLRELPRVPLRGEGSCGGGGALGTPLGLAQRKRASPRGEAGTSGFLSVSDSDRRVPAE